MSVPLLPCCLTDICNFLKASSLIELSEQQESIRAVILTLSFILIEIEACLRSEGQAAVIVQSEGLKMALTVAAFFVDWHTLAKCPFFEQLWQTASRAGQEARLA